MSVFAVESGTITAVENNFAFGTIVTITHRDGFVSTYASLADNVPVKKGDTVTKGQKIGEAVKENICTLKCSKMAIRLILAIIFHSANKNKRTINSAILRLLESFYDSHLGFTKLLS